jgi:hypothetical protein
MAKTYAECEAQVIAAHPSFSVQVIEEVTVITPDSDPEAYDAMVAERAQWCVDHSVQKDAQKADQDQQTGIVAKGQWLEDTATNLRDTTKAMTMQQLRNVTAEHMEITADIIRYLNKHLMQPAEETGT